MNTFIQVINIGSIVGEKGIVYITLAPFVEAMSGWGPSLERLRASLWGVAGGVPRDLLCMKCASL